MRESELLIDLSALRHNYQFLKSLLQTNSFFCPMVKADAYGMGANAVVNCLHQKENCNSFGVALIKEGISIRKSVSGDFQILVFSNFKHSDLSLYDEHKLTPVVSCFEELEHLKTYGWSKPFHLKYNLGINRLSAIKPKDTNALIKTLKQSPKLHLEAVCSHMSHAEYGLSDQSKNYDHAIQNFETIKKLWCSYDKNIFFHLFNSAGLIAESQKSSPIKVGARVGLSLYGVAPDFINSKLTQFAEQNLKPIFQCRSKIIRKHDIEKNEGTSYGWSWLASKKSQIGVIPLGYADGLKRSLSNKYSVWINEHEAPLIGTICMDYCMVDLTGLSQKDGIGSDVLFFSPDKLKILSIKKMAEASHSIPYEIMTGWGNRLLKTYIGET